MAAPKKRTPAKKVVQENNSKSTEQVAYDAQALMQEQFKAQLKMLLKSAAASGININEVFETPPAETTVTISPADLTAAISTAVKEAVWATKEVLGGKSANIPLDAFGKPVDASDLPPGSALPGGNFVAWKASHLNPDDVVTFTPLPIPSLTWPLVDSFGRYKIKIDKNGLSQWITVGETCTINKYFYQPYEDALRQWQEIEEFKRKGPMYAPWQDWKYTPFAASFGMNEDGRSLRNGPPTILDFVGGESPTTPAGEEGQ